MTDAEKLAAIRACAQTIINIVDLVGDAPVPPMVPPIIPVPPQPIPPTGDYPTGDALQWIQATLTREFNSNNAALTGMVGDPSHDLIIAMGGNLTDQPPAKYSKLLQDTNDANPLLTAALWLRHGLTLEQVLAQNFAPAQQINDLVHVMQHYNLLPA